jgi:hypothetical protein
MFFPGCQFCHPRIIRLPKRRIQELLGSALAALFVAAALLECMVAGEGLKA